MKTRKTRWYHKLCYRLSSPYRYEVEQGLNAMLHTGIGIGMRRILSKAMGVSIADDAPLPLLHCDQCGTQVLLADAAYCRRCGAALPFTGPQPRIVTTAPLPHPTVLHVTPGTLVRTYHQAAGGTQTKMLKAIGKAQLVQLMSQRQDKVS